MTKEEIVTTLQELPSRHDIEISHILADELLIEYIGDVEITEAYDKVKKLHG